MPYDVAVYCFEFFLFEKYGKLRAGQVPPFGFEESEVAGRTIAIGDIHGCATALETLLETLAPTSDDLIITLGDYVDRGPESRRVIDLLLDLEQRCELIALLGNHDLMLLRSIEHEIAHKFWMQVGGVQTLASYGGSLEKIPPDHLEFFHRLVPYHETDEFLFRGIFLLPSRRESGHLWATPLKKMVVLQYTTTLSAWTRVVSPNNG
jgi:predicted phosphodiesterase